MLFCPIPTPVQCHLHCHYLTVSTVLPEICKTQLPFSFSGLHNSAVLQSSSKVYEGILSMYLLYRVALVAPWRRVDLICSNSSEERMKMCSSCADYCSCVL